MARCRSLVNLICKIEAGVPCQAPQKITMGQAANSNVAARGEVFPFEGQSAVWGRSLVWLYQAIARLAQK